MIASRHSSLYYYSNTDKSSLSLYYMIARLTAKL
jgi:hypothetical protein